MKISFLITDMSQGGGMERVTAIFSNQLIKKGYLVKIISLIQENPDLIYSLDNDVRTECLLTGIYNRRQSKIKRLLTQIQILKKLAKYLKSDSSDLFIAQGFLPALLLWICGYGGRTIVCEHFKYELYTNYWVLNLRHKVYKGLKHVVTLTDKDANKFIQDGIDAETIPNMVPFTINDKVSPGISSSHKIICVGRLEYQKGFDLLINAVSIIKKDIEGWEIHIYGDGSLMETLNKLIQENECESIIKLKGYSTNIDYESYALAIVSSRFEGFPMVILEFMAKGIPIVSFDCPEGPSTLLKDDVGMLIPPENVDNLSEAIIIMTKDEELRKRYAYEGLRRASEYTPNHIIRKWEKLIENV